MWISSSLRLRVTVAILATVIIICGVFAIVITILNEQLKTQYLFDGMARELNEYEHVYAINPTIAPPATASLDSYLVDSSGSPSLPESFRGLSPGQHPELESNGRTYHVGVREIDGKTLVLAQDTTRIENREVLFGGVVFAGLLIALFSAIGIGVWLARIVVEPVNRLAERLQTLPPERRNPGLAGEFAEQEVGVIARAFDHYAARLDAFIARERSFTEDASHELRTPLAVLRNSLEILQQQDARCERDRRAIERMQRTLVRMSALVTALLFLAREPAAGERTAQVNLGDVVAEVLRAHQSLFAGKALPPEQSLEQPGWVAGPAAAVEIVVSNLLRNAIEHGGGDRIRVVVAGLALSIQDSGPGIDAQQQKSLFARGHAGPHSHGTGLGLYLVRRVCERYGWRVDVHSAPGQGAKFNVLFTGPPG